MPLDCGLSNWRDGGYILEACQRHDVLTGGMALSSTWKSILLLCLSMLESCCLPVMAQALEITV